MVGRPALIAAATILIDQCYDLGQHAVSLDLLLTAAPAALLLCAGESTGVDAAAG
jgi:hypothetical protein